jgi:hypothetical protein
VDLRNLDYILRSDIRVNLKILPLGLAVNTVKKPPVHNLAISHSIVLRGYAKVREDN